MGKTAGLDEIKKYIDSCDAPLVLRNVYRSYGTNIFFEFGRVHYFKNWRSGTFLRQGQFSIHVGSTIWIIYFDNRPVLNSRVVDDENLENLFQDYIDKSEYTDIRIDAGFIYINISPHFMLRTRRSKHFDDPDNPTVTVWMRVNNYIDLDAVDGSS